MPTPKPAYPAAFRQQMVELVRAGRGIGELAMRVWCDASGIRAWLKAAGGLDRRGADCIDAPLWMNERQEPIELRRKHKQDQQERDILAKAMASLPAKARSRPSRSQLVNANQAEHPVRTLCRTLRVSFSGYYNWLQYPACARAQADVTLLQLIRQAHAAGDATYGVTRIQSEIADQGIKVGHNRIAAVMRANGLRGVIRRLGWRVTTKRDTDRRPASDAVQRDVTATGIDQLWVADTTYIPTWTGFVYRRYCLLSTAARWWAGPSGMSKRQTS